MNIREEFDKLLDEVFERIEDFYISEAITMRGGDYYSDAQVDAYIHEQNKESFETRKRFDNLLDELGI